jgi:hypothetical protein
MTRTVKKALKCKLEFCWTINLLKTQNSHNFVTISEKVPKKGAWGDRGGAKRQYRKGRKG